MTDIFAHLLSAPAAVTEASDAGEWSARHAAAAAAFDRPIDRAIAGAMVADRLGYAFASGYREALRELIPGIGDARVAFCATEQGGNLPSEIRTALVADGDGGGWRMSGRKQWSTMGQLADELLVFATDGQDDKGRNRLALVRIPATRDGVEISPGHATQFVPEISHASIALSDVRVEPGERLDGDAYVRYLKPFRTVEDTHVHAALLGWLVGVGRRAEWPRDILARILALVGSVRDVAAEDVRSPGVHVALAGVIASTSRLVDELTPLWDRVDAGVRDRWRRDRALLNVAGKAREQRAAVAWERLTPG